MVDEPQRVGSSSEAHKFLSARCSDVDLHRIDVAARLLALKQPAPDPDGLLARTAAETRRTFDSELDAILFIAEMIRTSATLASEDSAAREEVAARRLHGLLAGLDDPEDIAAIRGLLRHGDLEHTLSLPAQRRIRRAVRRSSGADAGAVEGGGSTTGWDALLEALARSVAVDRESEVWVDAALEGGEGGEKQAARRNVVRGAIARGEREPAARSRPSGGDLLASPTLSGAGHWPPPERELLPPGQRIGRFTLLQRLGVGAMGVVYAAYDPELDRRIAVKLLRARDGRIAARAQARLLREAQAMARLAHPNVAVVHDVGTHEGDVFVAMEFIRGQTLQQWLRQEPRPWAQVVEAFIQAGRGLAAAHAAGLVHRDFKPSNAMIGDDGRVRVLDFGLCFHEPASDSVESTSGERRIDVRITRREEVVGTPAYMPPEQFLRGGVVGPASDQFSFCASLYEALYDQLPFAGDTVHAVSLAISRGELRPAPRGSRVPLWLHATVERGLRLDVKDRFPSMEALLRALDRKGTRTRGTFAIAAGLAAVAGLGGFLTARSQGLVEDPCSGGASEISEVWGVARRGAAEQALVSAGPAFAEEIWPRVAADLDRYATGWQDMHRDACLAHRRGETSDVLLDRRMACLARRKSALGEAVNVLADADTEVALHALEVVSQLPGLERCADLEALAAEVPPPADPKVRAAVEDLRPRLLRVPALDNAGLGAAAVSLADEVLRAAESLGEPTMLADALLQRGRLGIHRPGRLAEPEALLTRAYLTALAGRLDETAAEALALRLYVRGRAEGGATRALEDLPVAEAMVARLPSPGRVRGLLLNNAGAVAMAVGDAERGAALFREALAVREAALGGQHLEVAFTLVNLAMVSQQPGERMGLLQRALGIFDHELGEAHPQTIDVRQTASLYASDPREARSLLAPGCAALGRFSPDDRARRARCLGFLAHHAAEAGDDAAAAEALREVDELLGGAEAPPMPTPEAAALRGRAALYTGRSRPAATLLRSALAENPSPAEPWQKRQNAELELLLGLHLERLAQNDEAGAALSRAVTGFEVATAGSRDVLLQQRLAAARVASAAHSLSGAAGPEERRRAAALLTAAEQFYRSSGDGYAWRMPALRDLMRRTDTQ